MSRNKASLSRSSLPNMKNGKIFIKHSFLRKVTRHKMIFSQYVRKEYSLFKYTNPARSTGKDIIVEEDAYLEIYRYDDETQKYLETIFQLNHPNLQKCLSFGKIEEKHGPLYWALNKPYAGNLLHYLDDINNVQKLHYKNFAPSQTLTRISRGAMEGLFHLHKHKLCHGSLSEETLNYAMQDGTPTVKLANFDLQSDFSQEGRLEDWHAFGRLLNVISVKLDQLQCDVFTLNIKNAADYFSTLPEEKLKNLEQEVQKLQLFWSAYDRQKLIREFSQLINDSSLCRVLLKNVQCVKIPWNKFKDVDLGESILNESNDYNATFLHKRNYNVNDMLDLIKMLAAAYTHHNEGIRRSLTLLDKFVCSEFPPLFHELQKIKLQVESAQQVEQPQQIKRPQQVKRRGTQKQEHYECM